MIVFQPGLRKCVLTSPFLFCTCKDGGNFHQNLDHCTVRKIQLDVWALPAAENFIPFLTPYKKMYSAFVGYQDIFFFYAARKCDLLISLKLARDHPQEETSMILILTKYHFKQISF